MERLRSETDARDAMIGENVDLVSCQRVGIALDGKLGFVPFLQGQPFAERLKQAFELPGTQVRWCAAAQKQGPYRLRSSERGQLGGKGVEIQFDEIILAGGDGEITVAAVMRAKRNVNVGGARPQPGGERFRIRGGLHAICPLPGPPVYCSRAARIHCLTRLSVWIPFL